MIVETEIVGPVRNVLLNRPEKRNALNGEMLDRLLEAIFSMPPGPEERLAVIRAAGPVFCAGLDLSDHTVTTNPIEDMLHKIETYPLPVVAVVQGDAIAGGNELALHCDLVVASTHRAVRHVAGADRAGAELVPDQEAAGGRGAGHYPPHPAAGRPRCRRRNSTNTGADLPHRRRGGGAWTRQLQRR